jgi:hypothetical protein
MPHAHDQLAEEQPAPDSIVGLMESMKARADAIRSDNDRSFHNKQLQREANLAGYYSQRAHGGGKW